MALITKIIGYSECRKKVQTTTELKYNSYIDKKRGVIVVIGANGSATRKTPTKGSQNMQIDKKIATQLIKKLQKDFNIK